MTPDRWMAWFPVVLRYGALVGVLYETAFEQFDRPYLLALFGAMLGIGEVAQAVGSARKREEGGGDLP